MRSNECPIAETAFTTIFRDVDPYGSPFQLTVPARLLVFETDEWNRNPWGLSSADLGALLRAADDQDLERVFVSIVDPHDDRWDESRYVLSPLNADSYTHPGPMDAWPIVRSQDEMIAAWLEEWARHQDRSDSGRRVGDWIPAQLAHVVGPERAEAALRASRLRRWDLPAQ
jgi:hypothetical protein